MICYNGFIFVVYIGFYMELKDVMCDRMVVLYCVIRRLGIVFKFFKIFL